MCIFGDLLCFNLKSIRFFIIMFLLLYYSSVPLPIIWRQVKEITTLHSGKCGVLHFVHSAQHSVGLFSYIILYCVKLYWNFKLKFQFSSVQSLGRVWLFDPMNRNTPGLPVHHQLLESTQTHVHWAGDAIQLSHPLSFPSPPALNLSQHQGLFKWKKFQYIYLKR